VMGLPSVMNALRIPSEYEQQLSSREGRARMEGPTHSGALVQEIVDGFFVFAGSSVEAKDYRLVLGHG